MQKGLQKFLRRDAVDKIMFGYITALRHNLPSVTIERALELFIKHFEIEEVNLESAKKTYSRMQAEWLQTLKSISANGNNESSTGEPNRVPQEPKENH